MRKIIYVISILLLYGPLYGQVETKRIKVGNYQDKVLSNSDQGYAFSGSENMGFYYHKSLWDAVPFDHAIYNHRGWHFCCKDWTHALGVKVDYRVIGGQWSSDSFYYAVPDEDALVIRRYLRYTPPTITVDDVPLADPYPLKGDYVDPDKIPGTADVMVESEVSTCIGVTMYQRVLGWSQHNHDDYLIYDLLFVNTGNTDSDTEIELPDSTIHGFLLGRLISGNRAWDQKHWNCYRGMIIGDSIRLRYQYPEILTDDGLTWGYPMEWMGYRLGKPLFWGEAILHVDSSVTNPSDDPSQPRMTCAGTGDGGMYMYQDNTGNAAIIPILSRYNADVEELYRLWTEGTGPDDPFQDPHSIVMTPPEYDVYPGTYHRLPWEWWPHEHVSDHAAWDWISNGSYSIGPFELPPGDTLRIVFASVVGSIDNETSVRVGRDWYNGVCVWPGPGSYANLDNMPPPGTEDRGGFDKMPTKNDWAKNCWVALGLDSLFVNSWNANLNVQRNYEIPVPPPPPSINVLSMPDKIQIEWGNESESAPDLAGYRVYRGIGSTDTTFINISGDIPSSIHSYEDTDALRGVAYYYYVAAFDDGSHPEVSNPVGVRGIQESLESGRWLNRTTQPAFLTRGPGEDLSAVRVVPNPYNINAQRLQYPGEPDKIMFLDLPPRCIIYILNERGDLVKKIEHTDGSGDEAWADETYQHYMVTSSDQVPASGLYIAHIETPDGRSTDIKFLIVR